MRKPSKEELVVAAREAASLSYSPYSRFRVGAAVSAGGKIFTGTNIENASYGLTVCAERVAIFSAVAAGHRRIEALAVSCIDAPLEASENLRVPCGACRQVMDEFAGGEAEIIVDGVGDFEQREIFPMPFRLTES